MEIEVKDGSKFQLKEGIQIDFGRRLGFDSTDRTVSRRHVSFQLPISDHKDENRVCFKVIGKNPIWVYYSNSGEIRVYKRFERGEMESGDMFCISAKKLIWFTLKRLELGGENKNRMDTESGVEIELDESLQSNFDLRGIEELEIESIDASTFDPVKDFGSVVMGHEFDCYPKKMIRHIRNWDWFIDEPGEDSENNDVGGRRKRKKGGGGELDEEWTGEGEEDKEVITKARKFQGPKYLTRSMDNDRAIKGAKIGRNYGQKNNEVEEEEEEEEDETLGGFIVDEENVGGETESEEEEENLAKKMMMKKNN